MVPLIIFKDISMSNICISNAYVDVKKLNTNVKFVEAH